MFIIIQLKPQSAKFGTFVILLPLQLLTDSLLHSCVLEAELVVLSLFPHQNVSPYINTAVL